ncbi:MAG: nitroreductase family protein [bacterium]|nr:nitroreductase family protein [bacterium]
MGIVKCLEGRLVIMEYYDTINYRGWVKTFKEEKLDSAIEGKVQNYIKHLKGFQENSEEKFEIIRSEEIKKSHLGLFTTKAPYYFVVYIKDLETQLLNAGYLMGQLALYLMTKDLGSCLVGLETVQRYVSQNESVSSLLKQENEEFTEKTWVAIMAFGKPDHKLRQSGKRLSKLLSDKKCICVTEIDPRVQTILTVGVHAPSKMLVRPYRFVVKGTKAHILAKAESMMTGSQRMCVYLDCGIMLAYLGLKAEEQWMTMIAKKSTKYAEKKQKNYKYLLSLSFEDQ